MKIAHKKILITLFIPLFGCAVCAQDKKKEINSYEECIKAGNPILKTYPAQCITKDGRKFVNIAQKNQILKDKNIIDNDQTPATQKLCISRCGDGVCTEVACEGEGCPCKEDSVICPADCDLSE